MSPSKPEISGTTHILPFDKLSPDDFERMCVWLVRREGFLSVEHLGAAGSEQGRDIVAKQGGKKWAFQCKRVQRFSYADAKKEIDKLPKGELPEVYVFIVSSNFSADSRDKIRADYPKLEFKFWAVSELDEMVKRYPDIVEEFFQLATKEPEYQPEPLPENIDNLQGLDGLPPGSRMPFVRNAVFTGRETDLKDLAKMLLYGSQEDKAVGIVGNIQAAAAVGMGGIGKTQLAVEFCYRYGRYFRGVHWLAADQNIAAEIAECGLEMRLKPWPEAQEDQVLATMAAWKDSSPRLVVLDNLEDLQVLQKWRPRLGDVKILLTSRIGRWPPGLGVQARQLGALQREESRALLVKLAPHLEKATVGDLDKVAESYHDVPLGVLFVRLIFEHAPGAEY